MYNVIFKVKVWIIYINVVADVCPAIKIKVYIKIRANQGIY